MAVLHYGAQLEISLDDAGAKQAVDAIGAHATRAGWVVIVDSNGRKWSLLISAGIPIWVATDKPA